MKNPELDIVIRLKVGVWSLVAVEVHGEQHYLRGWSGESPEFQIAKDAAKARACQQSGVLLVEVPFAIFNQPVKVALTEIRDLFNSACGEEAIPEHLHAEALDGWAIGSLSRSDEILELQERLASRIKELGIEVISPIEEVLRTSSHITYRCPHCGEEKTAEASLLLQWSGHCHSCSKIVGNQQKRREWWEKVKEWCEHRQCTLLSEFQDYDRSPLSSERFFFLDEAGRLRSSLVFAVARPIRQPLKDRTMLAIDDAPQIIRARLDRHFPPNQPGSE